MKPDGFENDMQKFRNTRITLMFILTGTLVRWNPLYLFLIKFRSLLNVHVAYLYIYGFIKFLKNDDHILLFEIYFTFYSYL